MNSIKKFRIKERFKSKKNRVFRIEADGEDRVLKIFSSMRRLDREYNILRLLQDNLSVPSIYEINRKDRFLIMEFLPGENLCDFVNLKNREKIRVMNRLAEWLSDFHSFFKDKHIIRGDSILRNFIVDKEKLYGLDFEESRIGRVEEDLAEMCISILTTDEKFTDEKFRLCKFLLESYESRANLNLNYLNREIYRALIRFSERRNDRNLRKIGLIKLQEHGMINSVV